MKILRLGNDICELADIENSAESIRAEIGGGIEVIPLNKSLRLVINADRRQCKGLTVNKPASSIFMHDGGMSIIIGRAFLCSYDGIGELDSLTADDFETAKKILTSYGYTKGD